MRLLITCSLIWLFSFSAKGQTSIYTYKVDSIAGQSTISFSSFQGKKILIVCTASGDTSFTQYDELKQLYQIYKDSLVIIVFPTNSFNTESGSNLQITTVYTQNNVYRFPVTGKVNVKNPGMHPLFEWLTSAVKNGMMNSSVNRPGYKYLINKNGQFRGVYGPRIRPMSSIMRSAIETIN
jgi:glutathione peroxidase